MRPKTHYPLVWMKWNKIKAEHVYRVIRKWVTVKLLFINARYFQYEL